MTRHALATRLWHWTNLVCVVILFMSGLNISNAHEALYWGEWGFTRSDAWYQPPTFPGWMTIPGYYSLAEARHWHLLLAWPFAFGLLAFLLWSLVNRHVPRDIVTRPRDWRWSAVKADIAAHLKLNFDHGAGNYNLLQKLTYGLVLFVMLPTLIATGMTMSPALNASFPWMLDLFGGRQSARSIHFIMALALFAFAVLHVALVLLSGPVDQLRAMITGKRLEGADARLSAAKEDLA